MPITQPREQIRRILPSSPLAQSEQTDHSRDYAKDEYQHNGNCTEDADSSGKIGCERHLGSWIPIKSDSPPQ